MISIPFPGSKRNSYKYVKEIVKENGYTKVYEPFGGSGVLSVNLYNDRLVEKAVINDYDKYFDRYGELLDIKETIVNECMSRGVEKQRHKEKLSEDHIKILQNTISQFDKKWFPDIVRLNNFNHNLCSLRRNEDITIKDFKYFQNDLTTVKNRKYLKVINEIERDSLDYKDFIEKHKDDFDDKTLLIIDPPYVKTTQRFYKNETRFDETETVKLIEYLNSLNVDYIFFNEFEEVFNVLDCETIEINRSSKGYHCYRNPKDLLAYVKASKNGCLF